MMMGYAYPDMYILGACGLVAIALICLAGFLMVCDLFRLKKRLYEEKRQADRRHIDFLERICREQRDLLKIAQRGSALAEGERDAAIARAEAAEARIEEYSWLVLLADAAFGPNRRPPTDRAPLTDREPEAL